MIVTLKTKTVSEPNVKEHWAAKHRRAKKQRVLAKFMCETAAGFKRGMPGSVTITRVAPRQLDTDNLAASNKAIRDGIADALGIDDRADIWHYAQDKGESKEYGVRIEIV